MVALSGVVVTLCGMMMTFRSMMMTFRGTVMVLKVCLSLLALVLSLLFVLFWVVMGHTLDMSDQVYLMHGLSILHGIVLLVLGGAVVVVLGGHGLDLGVDRCRDCIVDLVLGRGGVYVWVRGLEGLVLLLMVQSTGLIDVGGV